MTLAVPYIPDDFDNNPFAEEDNPVSHLGDGLEEVGLDDETPVEPEAENVQEHSYTPVVSDAELARLLPERFPAPDSPVPKLLVQVVEVAPGKRENPGVRLAVQVAGLPGFRKLLYTEVKRLAALVGRFRNYLEMAAMECFVPALPVVGSDLSRFQRRLQVWFDRVTANPVLVRADEWVYFVENDFDYSVINTSRHVPMATGLRRRTLKQLPPPYDSFQDLAEFRPFVKLTHLVAQKLKSRLDRSDRALVQSATDALALAATLAAFAEGMDAKHTGMLQMWQALARTVTAGAQVAGDSTPLDEWLEQVVNDLFSVKEALTNRHLVMRELLAAQEATKSAHAKVVKMKKRPVNDPIRVDEAIRLLEDATRAERSLTAQVKRISGSMCMERTQVQLAWQQDLRQTLRQHALAKIDSHRKALRIWEQLRPAVRGVDATGGLLRLGRNLPVGSSPKKASQGRYDDEWSSRERRVDTGAPAEEAAARADEDVVDARAAAKVLANVLA